MIIDTHAHLFWESFEIDYDAVIQRAVEAGVTEIINVGVDVHLSEVAAKLSNDKIKFYSSIGIHPHEAFHYANNPDLLEEDINTLEQIYLSNPEKVVGVGECGLDYLGADETKELQKKLLEAQIDLAKKLNLPLLIHCRDDRSKNPDNTECWDKVIDMTKDHFGIYHCYSGLPATTNKILETTKFFFSFAGNITYPKNEYLREAVSAVPLERIVIETDCPFLPPQEYRGQRNEPSYIKETLKAIAELKTQPLEEVEKILYQNTKKILLNVE